jgi:hypothetical protein
VHPSEAPASGGRTAAAFLPVLRAQLRDDGRGERQTQRGAVIRAREITGHHVLFALEHDAVVPIVPIVRPGEVRLELGARSMAPRGSHSRHLPHIYARMLAYFGSRLLPPNWTSHKPHPMYAHRSWRIKTDRRDARALAEASSWRVSATPPSVTNSVRRARATGHS